MNIREKLMEIQSELKAPKNRTNAFGKYQYRSGEDILEAVKPLLHDNKLVQTISDEIIQVGERIYVKATVTLYDTEKEETLCVTAFARETEDKKGMDHSQVTGASSSYARKYALNGLYAIDDTQDADTMDNTYKPTQKKPTTKKAPPHTSGETREDVFSLAYQKGIEKGEAVVLWKKQFGDKADTMDHTQIKKMLELLGDLNEFGGTPLE